MSLIRKITPDDTKAVMALSQVSGLFNAEGIEQIRERLTGYVDGSDELWFGAFDNDLMGVVYCIPEPMTDGTWNILMLIVHPDSHGQGHGRALMGHIEETLMAQGARLVIVETSSADGLERARAFYPKCGYVEEARIRNFYTAGDDKIIFSKGLTA
jgi:ribosomal protein S18 acetylase RimI-like enzyme